MQKLTFSMIQKRKNRNVILAYHENKQTKNDTSFDKLNYNISTQVVSCGGILLYFKNKCIKFCKKLAS